MKSLFLFLFIYGISLSAPAAGFEGGMLTLDPTIMSTSSGENNNVPVTGSLVYITTSNNLDSITGFDPGQARGNLMLIANASASNYLVIKNNSTSSNASNRIITADSQDITLPPSNTEILGYDAVSLRWYVQRVPDVALNSYQTTPSDPSTTTSGTGVMMGLAGTITPTKSGKLLILVSGDTDNNTLGAGTLVQIRYGTGTAPSNGAALTGTAVGGLVRNTNPNLLGLLPGVSSFSLNAAPSGLTLGTAYWIDISLARVTSGTARARDISISLAEL